MIKTFNLNHTATNLVFNRKVYKKGLYELAKNSHAYKMALEQKEIDDTARYMINCFWLEENGFKTAEVTNGDVI